jgi:hypothetical protein
MFLLLQVFSLQTLEVFREDEMEALLCGAGEHWSPQQLADSMKFDHGYTSQSVPVRCAHKNIWHAACLPASQVLSCVSQRCPASGCGWCLMSLLDVLLI